MTVPAAVFVGAALCLVIAAVSPLFESAILSFSMLWRPATVHHDTNMPCTEKTNKALIAACFSEPVNPYIIVNTYDNSFLLKSQNNILRSGKCSTGSYILLKSRDRREWVFQTPRGRFSIIAKVESPVWNKPDWAFIEDGEPVPSPGAPERFENGVLGDYALLFGNGYMIHGTLYQRFLGLPVTHGCIRLGDDDLKAVYEKLEVGSFVFIY